MSLNFCFPKDVDTVADIIVIGDVHFEAMFVASEESSMMITPTMMIIGIKPPSLPLLYHGCNKACLE